MATIVVRWSGFSLSVSPDPAYASVGEEVTWEFSYLPTESHPLDQIDWTLYFRAGSPFRARNVFSVQYRPPFSSGDPTPQVSEAVVEAGCVDEKGTWKYGVRLEAVAGGGPQVLADDDPLLIVR